MDKIKKIYNCRLLKDSIYFKIIFVFWALIHSLSFGAYITSYFSPIIIIWGLLLLLKNVLFEDLLIKKSYMYILIVFLMLYVVTIIYNRQFNLVGNTKTLLWTAIMFFAIFVNERSTNKEKVYQDIRKLSIALTIGIFCISLISILMFCFDVYYRVNRGDGMLIPQGFWAARLWGIYVDPNQGATISIISLVSSVILLLNSKRNSLILNSVSIINIIIEYIFLILTGSRGGELSFIFVLTGLLYLGGDFILRNKLKNKYIRKLSIIILSFILSCGVASTFANTKMVLGKIPSFTIKEQQKISGALGIEVGKNEGNITMNRPDVSDEFDVSNGRLTLWKDGFRLIKYSPVFGFGDRNIFIKAKELTPGSSLEKQYVHNGFIHMLLSGGSVAVITMVILLILILIGILKRVLIADVYSTKYHIYGCISLIVGATLITSMFLTELFYMNSFISTIFWIYIGFVVAIDKEDLVD